MVNNSDESKIRLKRTSQFVNRARRFEIYLNNVHVNVIRDGEEVIIPVEKGHHELFIAMGYAESKKIDINIDNGQEVKLLCGSPIMGAKNFIPLIGLLKIVPHRYLFVKKIDE